MTDAELAAILAALPEPVLVARGDRRIRIANPAAAEMLGAGLIGQSAVMVIRHPEAVAAIEQALIPGNTAPSEARPTLADRSGGTSYRRVVQPLGPETGLDGALISFRDIGHIEEAEQMRRDFVANVSHELRSPLTVLSGFVETLRGAARDDAAARENFLEIMEQEAQRMNRLVDDLLSLSRVEANERVRPRDAVVLGEVIDATLSALRQQIEESGVHVARDGDGHDQRVRGDRDQLVQVFRNLVENAIKYGGAGGRVGIAIAPLEGMAGFSGPVVTVTVSDSGDGIDPLHLPRLTERFYRVDTHRSREMGGTGLGLAIVKHILNRHRGRLTVSSTPGEGSRFTVVLPRS